MTGRHASTLVLGAGPAGLTAGLETARRGHAVTVLEADEQVGGLARTVERDGFRFDLGGHRFFTKSPEVERLWHEVLGEEFLLRPRLSRMGAPLSSIGTSVPSRAISTVWLARPTTRPSRITLVTGFSTGSRVALAA